MYKQKQKKVLLNLSKSFDSVNHKILLNKLIKYNIDTFWFSSYLDNRTQSVKAGSHISEPLLIIFDVSQGSILGPILFLILMKTIKELSLQMTYRL